MPRVTVTLTKETLDSIDDFARHVGVSRSLALSSMLEMVVPMIGNLKATFDFIKNAGPDESENLFNSIGEIMGDMTDTVESFRGQILGCGTSGSEGANPRPCNNGGQVSPADLPDSPQPTVFSVKNPEIPNGGQEGGSNAKI